jgi:hypothetical protein
MLLFGTLVLLNINKERDISTIEILTKLYEYTYFR